jgi:DNA (cytosine-5)-methyltransferase 1
MITIGTDCSGIEAPIEALKQLGIPFRHAWCCEIDKFARKSLLANNQPELLYEDITKRDHSQLPDVDLYVCGFPCQSFSLMGKKGGTKDPRGNIMLHCIEVIKKKMPPIFILENVKNFKYIENGKPYNYLLNELYGILGDEDESLYNIHVDIYNTKDYGIPQNRERVYIIGISREIQIKDFEKPSTIEMKPLEDFILDKTVCKNEKMMNVNIMKKLKKINYQRDFIFPNSNYVNPVKKMCPTLTTRCDMFFHSSYNRYLSLSECLLLQGFSNNFKQVVSNTQMYKQIGNSMSVNVLKVILNEIFKCTLFANLIKNN